MLFIPFILYTRERGGQFVGSMVNTNLTVPSPRSIISPLNDTLEALPVQVLPDQPVPDALKRDVVTSILVKLPRVVVNVPPPVKLFSLKSIWSAVIVTPSLVKELPSPSISSLFHVTVMGPAGAFVFFSAFTPSTFFEPV